MSFIPLFSSLILGINVSQCGISLGIWRNYLIIKGPNSEFKPHGRMYTFKSITTLQLVEGNYLRDHKNDDLLREVFLTKPSSVYRGEKKTNDYLYIISPRFFYMSLDRDSYESSCLKLARELFYPFIRQYWIRNEISNFSDMEIK
jgi:hypothetical protein